jgi:hypothetical protein
MMRFVLGCNVIAFLYAQGVLLVSPHNEQLKYTIDNIGRILNRNDDLIQIDRCQPNLLECVYFFLIITLSNK